MGLPNYAAKAFQSLGNMPPNGYEPITHLAKGQINLGVWEIAPTTQFIWMAGINNASYGSGVRCNCVIKMKLPPDYVRLGNNETTKERKEMKRRKKNSSFALKWVQRKVDDSVLQDDIIRIVGWLVRLLPRVQDRRLDRFCY